MEQYTGFEPVPSAWKADMLAIEHQYCMWSRWQDSNLRHRDPKSRILPNWITSRYICKYSQIYSLQVPMVGIDNILKHCWGDGHYHALIPLSNPLFRWFSSARTNYFLWWAALDSNQECRSHGFTVRCVTNSAHRPIIHNINKASHI